MTQITSEQYARDQTWLKDLPDIESINAGLSQLQDALDSGFAEVTRLHAVLDADPGYFAAKNYPAPWRFFRTDEARMAHEKLLQWQGLPVSSRIATDYVRRNLNRTSKKYPLMTWQKLARKIEKWVQSK